MEPNQGAFAAALRELKDVTLTNNPNSMADRKRAELFAKVERAHAEELAELRYLLATERAMAEAYQHQLSRYLPTDSTGANVSPGDVVDIDGAVCCVGGVDTDGGIFYATADDDPSCGWLYGDAGECTVIDLSHVGTGTTEAMGLYDLAQRIADEWSAPVVDPHEMDRLVGRLLAVATGAAMG